MSDTTFQALMARKSDQGAVIALERITMADLPEADVTMTSPTRRSTTRTAWP